MTSATAVTLLSCASVPPGQPARSAAAQTYFEFQVEKPATVLEKSVLDYPPELKSAGVSGEVIAQFVVNEFGLPEMQSFKVLSSPHELFTASVKKAVPAMKFLPAEIGGRKVGQLVQLPFVFNATLALPSGALIRRRLAPDTVSDASKRAFALPASSSLKVYTESEVEKAVRNPDGRAVPNTLPAEVVAMFGGEHLLEFVVNADGRVAPGTVRLVKASSPLVASVPLGDMAELFFIPAELHGERVRQTVRLAMPVSIRPAR